MHYWNKDNFVGLLELARELETALSLRALAEYCVLREKGLRAQALARLDGFLSEATLWEVDMRRSNVLTILQASARISTAHQFMTHALRTQLVYPTLEQWITSEPDAVEPVRWLGLLRSDPDALRRALQLEPSDVPVRRRLINFALGAADHATHHLSESVLLSTVDETRAAISAAREWIATAPDIQPFTDLSAAADEYEQMIDDWVKYNQSPVGTFPQWCDGRGRTYSWPTVVYYNNRPAPHNADADTMKPIG
ncbi:MAG: hypothetical protein ACK5D9_01440 [Burkholderiales bacterium]|jgi:hypothetical protein